MKAKKLLPIALAVLILLLAGCGAEREAVVTPPAQAEEIAPEESVPPAAAETAPEIAAEEEKTLEMKLQIEETQVTVAWEENDAVDALRELVREKPLTIRLSMYGGFEQVGPIGTSLPRDDRQTTTAAGDIVLYAGNQIVLFYGSNSWAYTRLGHITDPDSAGMEELLGQGDVSITLSLG